MLFVGAIPLDSPELSALIQNWTSSRNRIRFFEPRRSRSNCDRRCATSRWTVIVRSVASPHATLEWCWYLSDNDYFSTSAREMHIHIHTFETFDLEQCYRDLYINVLRDISVFWIGPLKMELETSKNIVILEVYNAFAFASESLGRNKLSYPRDYEHSDSSENPARRNPRSSSWKACSVFSEKFRHSPCP